MNLVEFKNVSRSYQLGEVSVTALRDVTLNIPKSAFTALVGPFGREKLGFMFQDFPFADSP